MNLLEWMKSDDGPPDTWTPERAQKATLVGHCGGDMDAARTAWQLRNRMAFAAFLVDHRGMGRGDTSADGREAGL